MSRAVALGRIRVSWVKVEVGAGSTVCEIVGSAHGRPVTRRVPLGTATRLVAQGAPVVVHPHQPVHPPQPALELPA